MGLALEPIQQVADVEVTIVSLAGGPQLARCLAALPQACVGLSWRVTLIDNSVSGLDLGDVDALPHLTVVRSIGRRGFGANQNLALTQVLKERRARYALLLNDDAESAPDAVAALVRHADTHPKIGAVAPVIRSPGGGGEPSILAWPTVADEALSWLRPGRPSTYEPSSGWLNGACVLTRVDALAQVGLFDPRFFLFYEETDLCRRLVDSGWRTGRCLDATILHQKHHTAAKAGSAVAIQKQILRSRYLYFRKHHGPTTARILNGLTRCALLARAAKLSTEVRFGRSCSESTSPRILWELARYAPSHATTFEIEARAATAEV